MLGFSKFLIELLMEGFNEKNLTKRSGGSGAEGLKSTSFKAHCLSSIKASITTPQTPRPSSCRISTVTGFDGGKSILSGRAYILVFLREYYGLATTMVVSWEVGAFLMTENLLSQRGRKTGGKSVV